MNEQLTNKALALLEGFKKKKVTEEDLQNAEMCVYRMPENNTKEDFKLLLKMFRDVLQGRWNLNWKSYAILGAAILYVVSPIDAIPDFIPFLGWIDDAWVIAMVVGSLVLEINAYKMSKETFIIH
ncbi:MAG: DUF1232 domain-containing protein [Bacteroidetes bacterium]|nr:DUF1232 domain-containing protein [Bacteroidota bacterium]